MQHNLVRRALRIRRITLTPIIAHRVSEDITSAVERGARDRAPNSCIALKAVLSVLIPEVEGTIASSGAEGAVDGVEADGVDGVDVADVAVVRRGFTVAFEREV